MTARAIMARLFWASSIFIKKGIFLLEIDSLNIAKDDIGGDYCLVRRNTVQFYLQCIQVIPQLLFCQLVILQGYPLFQQISLKVEGRQLLCVITVIDEYG